MAERVDAVVGAQDAIRGQITPNNDGSITPPDNIIKTIQAARAVYYKYRSEHIKRIELYSRIEGLLAGNQSIGKVFFSRLKVGNPVVKRLYSCPRIFSFCF